jgi:hypothetical protein
MCSSEFLVGRLLYRNVLTCIALTAQSRDANLIIVQRDASN